MTNVSHPPPLKITGQFPFFRIYRTYTLLISFRIFKYMHAEEGKNMLDYLLSQAMDELINAWIMHLQLRLSKKRIRSFQFLHIMSFKCITNHMYFDFHQNITVYTGTYYHTDTSFNSKFSAIYKRSGLRYKPDA